MPIVVQTNTQSLGVQRNLNSATSGMEKAMTRMSSGLKINGAKDDSAGFFVATTMNSQIRGSEQAKANANMGLDLLSKTEGDLASIQSLLERNRELTVQASNEIYDAKSMDAIKTEIKANNDEISRIANASTYNGKELLTKSASGTLTFQIGANSTASTNAITVSGIFVNSTSSGLGVNNVDGIFTAGATSATVSAYLDTLDTALNKVVKQRADIGAYQCRFEAVIEGLDTNIQNLTASKSTLMDADIATESSNYVKNQILQQMSVSLLSQANQLPAAALNMI